MKSHHSFSTVNGDRAINLNSIEMVQKMPDGSAVLSLSSGVQVTVKDHADDICKELGCSALDVPPNPNKNGPVKTTDHMGGFTAASLPPSAGGEYPGQEPVMPNMNQPGAGQSQDPAAQPVLTPEAQKAKDAADDAKEDADSGRKKS